MMVFTYRYTFLKYISKFFVLFSTNFSLLWYKGVVNIYASCVKFRALSSSSIRFSSTTVIVEKSSENLLFIISLGFVGIAASKAIPFLVSSFSRFFLEGSAKNLSSQKTQNEISASASESPQIEPSVPVVETEQSLYDVNLFDESVSLDPTIVSKPFYTVMAPSLLKEYVWLRRLKGQKWDTVYDSRTISVKLYYKAKDSFEDFKLRMRTLSSNTQVYQNVVEYYNSSVILLQSQELLGAVFSQFSQYPLMIAWRADVLYQIFYTMNDIKSVFGTEIIPHSFYWAFRLGKVLKAPLFKSCRSHILTQSLLKHKFGNCLQVTAASYNSPSRTAHSVCKFLAEGKSPEDIFYALKGAWLYLEYCVHKGIFNRTSSDVVFINEATRDCPQVGDREYLRFVAKFGVHRHSEPRFKEFVTNFVKYGYLAKKEVTKLWLDNSTTKYVFNFYDWPGQFFDKRFDVKREISVEFTRLVRIANRRRANHTLPPT